MSSAHAESPSRAHLHLFFVSFDAVELGVSCVRVNVGLLGAQKLVITRKPV